MRRPFAGAPPKASRWRCRKAAWRSAQQRSSASANACAASRQSGQWGRCEQRSGASRESCSAWKRRCQPSPGAAAASALGAQAMALARQLRCIAAKSSESAFAPPPSSSTPTRVLSRGPPVSTSWSTEKATPRGAPDREKSASASRSARARARDRRPEGSPSGASSRSRGSTGYRCTASSSTRSTRAVSRQRSPPRDGRYSRCCARSSTRSRAKDTYGWGPGDRRPSPTGCCAPVEQSSSWRRQRKPSVVGYSPSALSFASSSCAMPPGVGWGVGPPEGGGPPPRGGGGPGGGDRRGGGGGSVGRTCASSR